MVDDAQHLLVSALRATVGGVEAKAEGSPNATGDIGDIFRSQSQVLAGPNQLLYIGTDLFQHTVPLPNILQELERRIVHFGVLLGTILEFEEN